MLLAIDVGNTNTVIGLFDSPETSVLVDQWRASTSNTRTADEWRSLISDFLRWRDVFLSDLHGVVICSVVPQVTANLRRMCSRIKLEPLVVDWRTDTGLKIAIDNPSEVGADRLANAVAARAQLESQAIIVDMGTATTLDIVSADDAYLGGVIVPGIDISLDALFSRAAALRRIDLVAPSAVIGTSTETAVQSGATYGYASMVDGICGRIEQAIGACRVIATGGLSSVIAPVSERIEAYDVALTLIGLRLIYERNHP